ncbi:hypothetical protein HS125_20745 [bacterium]|nr:hypothetical protein [bacterium]
MTELDKDTIAEIIDAMNAGLITDEDTLHAAMGVFVLFGSIGMVGRLKNETEYNVLPEMFTTGKDFDLLRDWVTRAGNLLIDILVEHDLPRLYVSYKCDECDRWMTAGARLKDEDE